MSQFFETICIKNTYPQRINLHQDRLNQTMKKFYKNFIRINLKSIIKKITFDSLKTYKLRINYSNKIGAINFSEYYVKVHKRFRLVKISRNIYKYKFQDRNRIIRYLNSSEEEVIFVLNNHLTDTTYSNLVFKKNMNWFTPKSFLLKGTQREYLISKNKIIETEITLNNLKKFESFKLINSMLNLEMSYEYSIKQILIYL